MLLSHEVVYPKNVTQNRLRNFQEVIKTIFLDFINNKNDEFLQL